MRIFVSSESGDDLIRGALVAALRAAGANVWTEAENEGAPEHEIATRPVFLVLLSEAALTAKYVQLEVASAVQLKRQGNIQRLVAVVLDGCRTPPIFDEFQQVDLHYLSVAPTAISLDAVVKAVGLRGASSPQRELVPLSSASSPPGGVAQPIVLPPQLSELGFTGWHVDESDVILPPLAVVAGGEFVMGSDSASDDANERPRHHVRLAMYAIGTYPVTVAEYACFVAAGHALPPDRGRVTWGAQFSRLDHPVVNITWHDAIAYARWLAARTEGSWRLSSEAEWECAARWDAATQVARIYPWGGAFDSERCNTKESTIGSTTPIGTYPNGASPCGARDMLGNVREWTLSRYVPYPYDPTDGRENLDAPGDRVQRGGSWFNFAGDVRAGARDGQPPDEANPFTGFRLVLEAPNTK